MKLYLMRHGAALSDRDDPTRPLSEQGRLDIQKSATELVSEKDFSIQTIYHSGKTRAAQTAEIMSEVIAPGIALTQHPGLNPNDIVDQFVEEIEGFDNDTLVVGHLPFLGVLAGRLTGREHLFNLGEMICLLSSETQIPWVRDW